MRTTRRRLTTGERISTYGAKKFEAIEWVALNDDTATQNVEEIAGYISTKLVADLWYNGDTAKAARDISFIRDKEFCR